MRRSRETIKLNGDFPLGEFKSWQSYRDFERRIKSECRFIRSDEDQQFLRTVLETSKDRVRLLPADRNLWRAQLGCDWEPQFEEGVHVGDLERPFPQARMKPIPNEVRENRANPRGIPCLYLSTRKETAMSEVRPWIGSLISCGLFKTARELRIVDFSVHHDKTSNFYFEEPDATEREQSVWTNIDQAFSNPVTREDVSTDYIPTQVIAEFFKCEGYDGIAYKSTFGKDGYNVALFNLNDAALTYCELHEVKAAEFTFDKTANPYWVKDDRTTITTEITDIRPVSSDDHQSKTSG